MNPNQVMPYQYSEPWIRPSPLYPGPHLMNNGVTPQFYCDNTNQVANFMSYPQAVLNPFASVNTNQNIHPYPRRQALLQIVDPNTGKNILDDILNKPAEDGSSSSNVLQAEDTRCQNEENLSTTPQQMMMMPAQHSVAPWPQDLCQQLQQIPDTGSPPQQQQQLLEPVVVQVPVVVYLRGPA